MSVEMGAEALGEKVTELIDKLSSVIERNVGENFSILYDAILPLWMSGMMVYFFVNVYQMLYSNEDINFNVFFKNMAILALIFAFLGASGWYISDVVPFVMNAGDEVSGAVAGDSASSLVQSILVSTGKTITKIWEEAFDGGFFEVIGFVIIAFVQTLFVIVGGIALGIYALAYIIITKMMIGLVLSLGGVFIMMGAIPMFRNMFTAWIATCFNYIFLNIAFSISFSLVMEVINELIDTGNMGLDFLSLVLLLVFYAIAILILQQVTVLVSSLTGGVGINGLTSAVNQGLGMTNSARKYAFGKQERNRNTRPSRASNALGAPKRAFQAAKNFLSNGVKG